MNLRGLEKKKERQGTWVKTKKQGKDKKNCTARGEEKATTTDARNEKCTEGFGEILGPGRKQTLPGNISVPKIHRRKN